MGKETHNMIKGAYGDAAIGDRVFLSGTRCSEKSSLSSNRRMSIRIIADELSLPQAQVFEIATGTLAVRKVGSAKPFSVSKHQIDAQGEGGSVEAWPG
ncbi:hypothetical protein TNCV_3954261 [Trichonephila clavipes]|nr:hypothetical protein TNCV_3954261 [Trichonephila clavipes]